MTTAQKLGERIGKALKSGAVERAALTLAGAAAVLWGVAQWSPPAAACAAGIMALTAAAVRGRRPTR